MIFANGTRKAGFFRENVLIELLVDYESVEEVESTATIPFPESFR